MPKVSVIVTTYNRPEYLSETLDAIFSQTYRDFDVTLVDDGSKVNYVDAYQEKYPDLRVIRKENAGVSSARNAGVAQSKGEWIAFCDDDDNWVADKLERQVEAIDSDPKVGLIHGNIEMIDVDGKRIKSDYYVDNNYFNRRGDAFIQSIESFLVKSPTPFIKRTLFEQIGGFNQKIKIGEDVEFYMKAAFFTRFLYIDAILAKYRLHNLGQLSQKKVEYLLVTPFLLQFVKEQRANMSMCRYCKARKAIARRHLWEMNYNSQKMNVRSFVFLLKIYFPIVIDLPSVRKMIANIRNRF